jgi:hypothetical protein
LLGAFHNDKSRKDGKHPICKVCRRAYARSERGQAARQKWLNNGGRERMSAYAQTDAAKQKRNARLKRDRDERKKAKVRRQTQQAVKSGLLRPPTDWRCLGCYGQSGGYHHHDYDKPMDVTPLCHNCHMSLHAHLRQM